MADLSRRIFLGTTLAELAAANLLAVNATTAAAETAPVKKVSTPVVNQIAQESPDKPSTLFLTWQRDPTTTMTVQWVGPKNSAVDTQIYYLQVDGPKVMPLQVQPTKVKPYPLGDLYLFRAELTGLRPGSDYFFGIGQQKLSYRFRTAPATATNSIHFISGGDCGVNEHAIANNVQAARQDPLFAIIGGDLAYDDGRNLNTNLGFLQNYSKTMIGRDGRIIPLIAGIGNHEVDGGFDKPRSRAPFFYSLFDGLYPEQGFATLDFGDYLSLVMLDTGHTTKIRGEQTDWLEQTLRSRVDHPNVMVVNHVPCYPSHREAETKDGKPSTGGENRKHWVPLFEKYRVPVVLEHHEHTFKRTKPLINGLANNNGVLYLGDGSWGKIRPLAPPEKLTHLARASESYHLSLHCLEGNERFHLALDKNGRVMDVSRTGQRTKGLVAVSG